MELANKVIAITGAGQGLGKQMALSLAQSGVHLALIDLNPDQLAETKAECESLGVTARFYVTNVTDEQQVCTAFAQIEADFKQLNGVINNAGIMRDGMFIKVKDGQINTMSLEQFQSVLDVNVTGTFLCGREACKVMLNTDSKGVLINISSVARAGEYRSNQLLCIQSGSGYYGYSVGERVRAFWHSFSGDCTGRYQNRNDRSNKT